LKKSKISDHQFKKGVFVTPFNQIENLKLQHWNFDRLPAYIWLGFIIDNYGHTDGLERCFKIIKYLVKDLSADIDYPAFNKINKLSDDTLEKFYLYVCEVIDKEILYPLTLIYPYSLFPIFNKYFNQQKLHDNRLERINEILKETYDHQSYLSTDIRFIIIWSGVLADKLKFFKGLQIVDALQQYAYCSHEDEIMKQYRPTIRATEGPLGSMPGIKLFDTEFNEHFWKEISEMTDCKLFVLNMKDDDDQSRVQNYLDYLYKIMQYYEKFLRIFNPINKKAEVLLSILTYSYKRIKELVEHNLFNEISGRSIMRSVTENLIIMKYLVNEESNYMNIWEEYISYGFGQYKLIRLRYVDKESSPQNSHLPLDFMDVVLESETNEEFLNMDTRYFDKKNVREKAILVNEKELFDYYYDYDSQFEHGLWGAIRESVSLICDNPSHKYHHSIDIEDQQKLKSVWNDCELIMNKTIQFMNSVYPLPSELINYE